MSEKRLLRAETFTGSHSGKGGSTENNEEDQSKSMGLHKGLSN